MVGAAVADAALAEAAAAVVRPELADAEAPNVPVAGDTLNPAGGTAAAATLAALLGLSVATANANVNVSVTRCRGCPGCPAHLESDALFNDGSEPLFAKWSGLNTINAKR